MAVPSLSDCDFQGRPHLIHQVVSALFSDDENVYFISYPDTEEGVIGFGRQYKNQNALGALRKLWRPGGEHRTRVFRVLNIVASTGDFHGLALNLYDLGYNSPSGFRSNSDDFWFGIGKERLMRVEEVDLPIFETNWQGLQIMVFQDEDIAKCIEMKVMPELKLMKEYIKGSVELGVIEGQGFSTEFTRKVWSGVLAKMAVEDAGKGRD